MSAKEIRAALARWDEVYHGRMPGRRRVRLVRLSKSEASAARRIARWERDDDAAAERLGIRSPQTAFKAIALRPISQRIRERIVEAIERELGPSSSSDDKL